MVTEAASTYANDIGTAFITVTHSGKPLPGMCSFCPSTNVTVSPYVLVRCKRGIYAD